MTNSDERWQSFYSGFPHALNVDRHGRRYADEANGHGRDFHATQRERAHTEFAHVWVIFDAQYRDKYPVGKTAPGEPLPEPFKSAETLAGLAGLLDLDRHTLEVTVAEFNHHAGRGRDPLFRRGENPWAHLNFGDPRHQPNPNLGTIDKPSFYGARLEIVGNGMTQVGLRTDDRARVLGAEGPIPGLYAAGNSMAWLDLGPIGHGGTSNTRGMTWGYIAAHDAAGTLE